MGNFDRKAHSDSEVHDEKKNVPEYKNVDAALKLF
jgi:hypothetical protein